jgi:hypothetical protein
VAKIEGYHEVATFYVSGGHRELPPGWKPFASFLSGGQILVVCRKWTRVEQEVSPSFLERIAEEESHM